jgi:hypothetical protein
LPAILGYSFPQLRQRIDSDTKWFGRFFSQIHPGTDVMIFKIFFLKNSAKKLAFLTQNKAKLCTILIITMVFEKNANFFAENFQKLQKIVIITSVPGHPGTCF